MNIGIIGEGKDISKQITNDIFKKSTKKILFVGGTWTDEGGRPSSMVFKFANALEEQGVKVDLYNGGFYDDLTNIIELVIYYDYVLWWANVPNDKPKIRNVKEINSRTMLVTSKRNDDNKYTFAELINRALQAKANLCVEFSNQENKFRMRVFDPLGNVWYEGFEILECGKILLNRIEYLASMTRQKTVQDSNPVVVPNNEAFFDIVKYYGDVFHSLINPDGTVQRYLGNSSFRCQRGFPSFKQNGQVYVSRRNVDKRYIEKDAFVPVNLEDGVVYYSGQYKPSVDTPIQLRLYEMLPKINYMIHAHVYIDGAPFTDKMVPCGALEEVACIMNVIGNNTNDSFYAINLKGHGCIVMSDDLDKLANLPYMSRPMPEKS